MRELFAAFMVLVGTFVLAVSALFYALAGGFVDWSVPAGLALGPA